MSTSKIELLGSKIQLLTAEVQNGFETNPNTDRRSQLLDALDDLRAELLEPAEWPFSFLAPPDFAAMQVAFQREVFQHVPLKTLGSAKHGVTPSIHIKDLAPLVKMDEDRLLRIMRLLEANRVFTEVQEKKFTHTPLSAGMANEYVAAHVGGQLNSLFQASSSLADSIEGGYPNAWVARFGMPLYEHFEKKDSKVRARFAKSMLEYSRQEMKQLSTIFPWETVCKVVDIGGGAGHLAAYLAHNHKHLDIVNQDLPMVVNDAASRITLLPPEERVAYDQVTFEAHNYYEPQPRSNIDVFILRHCLHNNTHTECAKILRAVVPGLEKGRPEARLLVIEKLLPAWGAPNTPYKTKKLRREDVVMMISCGGKERTLEDFRTLMEEADRRLVIDQVYYGENNVAIIAMKLSTLSHANGV
ncbi:MAG: hypothetical protein Q9201_002385 [Fulgogasparrea decipioides]